MRDMSKWWLEKPMRLIQTNLREIDAGLDADIFIKNLKEFSADVVLFNVGGIVANYPTKLEYHYKNPHMKDDLTGKVLTRAHAEGIRFIARFDFSKVNECYTAVKPQWLYKSVKGESINYNGQVQVCVNSEYQQEYSLKILEEVIDNYHIDAVFFNMIGYRTTDYSGNYHGICQCDNCRKRFKDMYGLELPVEENGNDPVYRQYVNFTDETSRGLFKKNCRLCKK